MTGRESLRAPLPEGPGCPRHEDDPHNLCEACWALEPDPATLTVTQGGIGDTAGFFLPPREADRG